MASIPVTARRPERLRPANVVKADGKGAKWRRSLNADIIIANGPDPLFVSDLQGKILQASDAVSQLLGFRQDEVLEQSQPGLDSPREPPRTERGGGPLPGRYCAANAG